MKIWVIATLDTKYAEAGFIAGRIRETGNESILVDPGSAGTPGLAASFPREQVAEAGGESLGSLQARGDKAYSQDVMREGLKNLIASEFAAGRIDGVIAVGGGQGTALATAAMQTLPFGVPKVMVSTVACGQITFGPYVGTSDMTMIHSVADIAGLNFVTRKIIAQAAAAVVAMAGVKLDDAEQKPLVALTQAGVTTPGTMAVKAKLEEKGFDVVVFHCNGIGGQAMEDFIRQGVIQGVIDYSPHELIDLFCDGLMPAMPGRMTAAGEMGIPQIVGPGCADMRLHVWGQIPDELDDRPYVRHTPTHTHFRTTYDELHEVGTYIAEHLNAGKGPRAAIVPTRGYSMMNREGMPLYDEAANKGYEDALKEQLNDDVGLLVRDKHINDEAFAEDVVELFMKLWDKQHPEDETSGG
jgi:uncharacterized protein (UPF0261 family)